LTNRCNQVIIATVAAKE